MARYIHDEKTGVGLCFPDTLVYTVHSVDSTSPAVLMYTIGAEFICDEDDLNQVPNSRPLTLDNASVNWKRPAGDPQLVAFKFVRTDTLSGTLLITVNRTYEAAFLANLSGQPGYLSPEYKGTTEEFYASVEVARVELGMAQLKKFNKERSDLLGSLGLLEGMLQKQVPESEQRRLLFRKLINEHARISKEWINHGEQWSLSLSEEKDLRIPLFQVMPKVDMASGKPENFRVKVVGL